MRKAAIIAVVAIGSSLAAYASVNKATAKEQKTQTECCDKTECCPKGGAEECCEYGCE